MRASGIGCAKNAFVDGTRGGRWRSVVAGITRRAGGGAPAGQCNRRLVPGDPVRQRQGRRAGRRRARRTRGHRGARRPGDPGGVHGRRCRSVAQRTRCPTRWTAWRRRWPAGSKRPSTADSRRRSRTPRSRRSSSTSCDAPTRRRCACSRVTVSSTGSRSSTARSPSTCCRCSTAGSPACRASGCSATSTLPTMTAEGDPQQQIAELESALGRDLPEDFGQLVVYESDRLSDAQASMENAQRTLVLAKRAWWVLLIATVALIALTIVVARNRWRAALLLGLGTVAAIVIARTGVRRVRDDAPDLIERPGGKAALAAMLDGAASGLLRTFGLVLLAGAVVALIALLPPRSSARRSPAHRRRRRWRRRDRPAGVQHLVAPPRHRRRRRGAVRRQAALAGVRADPACRGVTLAGRLRRRGGRANTR